MERESACACRCLTIPGFCFKPSDEELVGYFLREKIAGKSLCCDHSIAEFKIYDDKLMPWEILKDGDSHWRTYSNDSLDRINKSTIYVFTELCKKNTRVTRRSGSGSWKGQNTRFVKNVAGDDIGYKKLLTFYEDDDHKKGNKKQITYEGHGHWIMNEYSLLGIDNYVVCKITKEVKISSQASSCSSTKVAATKQESHSHCKQKEADIPVPDVVIVRGDVEDMNKVLGDERQFGDSDHDEPGADWDKNGWQTELDNELIPYILDETTAKAVEEFPGLARMNEPPQVQGNLNFHIEEIVQELGVAVWGENEKKYESGKGFNGANNYEVTEILDDDYVTDSIQELAMIRAADDPPRMMLPISVAENNRVCTNNIPDDDLSNFLNYIAQMDGGVAVQETPVATWEDHFGSTTMDKILNDFSNFENAEAALAVEPTNATLGGLDVMLDIPFHHILNLPASETKQQICNTFQDQPRKRLLGNVDDCQEFVR